MDPYQDSLCICHYHSEESPALCRDAIKKQPGEKKNKTKQKHSATNSVKCEEI